VAFHFTDAGNISLFWDKNFLFGELSCEKKKKTLPMMASVFFSRKSSPSKKCLS
jgi:hypothetical protein